MNGWHLAWKSLRHYWRTNLGVLAGTAIGTAVLVGALVVGDSVRWSLRQQALLRIGQVEIALLGNDRFFKDDLAQRLSDSIGQQATVAPVVYLRGVASTADSSHRANAVQVLGVDERFFALGHGGDEAQLGLSIVPEPGHVGLNRQLAEHLRVAVGDTILLRVEQPSAMPRDMVMATADNLALALRVQVSHIVPDQIMGRFGLQADQVPPFNAFLPLPWLQSQTDMPERANVLLVGGVDGQRGLIDTQSADEQLGRVWTLADGELATATWFDTPVAELQSTRIFLDQPVGEAIAASPVRAMGVLTYFVNELAVADRSTPYSMVSGLGYVAKGSASTPAAPLMNPSGVIPVDLADDEVVINGWLAQDLQASVGEQLRIKYYVMGTSGKLLEEEASFSIRQVIPIEGLAGDELLMPEFPGLADSENCRDWSPGIPIDLDRIRDTDEEYWDEYHGTPKAFINLTAAQRLWGNRFGELTGIRVADADIPVMEARLREALQPETLGLYFRQVRQPALSAASATTDFGGLFIGLSMFLIVAAVLLTSLLFALGIDQRSGQIGILQAMGFDARSIRRLLLQESLVIAALGVLVGLGLGLAYTALVLAGLRSIWRHAVADSMLSFHASPLTLLIGATLGLAAAILSMWLAFRRHATRPAAELLAEEGGAHRPLSKLAERPARWSMWLMIVCLIAAAALVIGLSVGDGSATAGGFFGAGAILLLGGLAASRWCLSWLNHRSSGGHLSLGGLGFRNSVRRAGRSLATITLLACGSFLVIAVGANRLEVGTEASERSSGTGGFGLIGQSTLPVLHDLNDPMGLEAFGLDSEDLPGVSFVPLRVRDGDDASCLNLNRASNPKLLGVAPRALADREAFSFVKTLDHAGSAWELLQQDLGPDVVAGIGDHASVTWALHKKVGDELEYVDERGRPLRVRIVGTVANSILQGNLLIDEARFESLFPAQAGHRMFLIDTPPDQIESTSATLGRALRDVGLELFAAPARLAQFNSVQNAYLGIFQVLGSLGLLLGSVGLAMVVYRNVAERRDELTLLGAVGYTTSAIKRLVLSEHTLLLGLGLGCGAVAALLAVLPGLSQGSGNRSGLTLLGVVVAVALSGGFWVWLATRVALGRGLGHRNG